MANTRSKSSRGTSVSGISRLNQVPKVLPYPQLLTIEEAPSIKDAFCYVIKHYGTDGISVLIYRQPDNDQVTVLFGDWKGNNLDIQTDKPTKLSEAANEFVAKDVQTFVNLMHSINIPQAQFFLAIDETSPLLVDMQLSLNKFAGPGMIRDLFGKIYRTQEIRKIEIIDARAMEAVERGTGSYENDIILKPSVFKMHHNQKANSYQPLYVEVRR